MNFKLDDNQQKKLDKWIKENIPDKYTGAIGGRFTYSFTPTSIGMIVIVEDCITKQGIDLTDYEGF